MNFYNRLFYFGYKFVYKSRNYTGHEWLMGVWAVTFCIFFLSLFVFFLAQKLSIINANIKISNPYGSVYALITAVLVWAYFVFSRKYKKIVAEYDQKYGQRSTLFFLKYLVLYILGHASILILSHFLMFKVF